MNERYRSTYLVIERDTEREKGKTCVWIVLSTGSGALLGQIKWFGRWRQYCFFPSDPTIFNPDCLHEIADFTALQTKNRMRR